MYISYLLESEGVVLLAEFGELTIFEFIDNSESEHIVVEGEMKPNIIYKKKSNTSYVVNVENANVPYSLILKESYNNGWKAKVQGEELDKHFLAYDYANGWYIDQLGSYNIELVFKVWPWE